MSLTPTQLIYLTLGTNGVDPAGQMASDRFILPPVCLQMNFYRLKTASGET